MADKFISLDRLSLIKNWVVGLLGSKQDALVSGTNLKTVNGQSLLGSGNINTFGVYEALTIDEVGAYFSGDLYSIELGKSTDGLNFVFTDSASGIFDVDLAEKSYVATKADLVPNAVNGEVLVTDASGQPQSSGTDLATLLNLVPEVKTSGNWKYRVDKNGFFEAWYMQTGYTVTINNQSGTLYRSQQITFTLPADLVGSKTPTIQYAKPDIAHNNYPVWCGGANFSGSNVLTYALSGGSRSSSPNYTLECYVTGTLS